MARRKKRCIESYSISEGMDVDEVKRLLNSGTLHYIEHNYRRRNKRIITKTSELKDNEPETNRTGSVSIKDTEGTA